MNAVLLALVLAGHAVAQDAPSEVDVVVEAAVLPGIAPGTPPPADQVDALAREVSSGLRCPVCQGLSVADSTSAAATQMHRRIHDLVAAGYDRRQIEDYFVSKYGEWVLLDPRSSGLNLIVWVGPLAGLVLALVVSSSLLRRREPEDRDPDTVVDESVNAVQPEDPHTARLLAEVERD